jgi:hypothetical protein
VGDCWSTCIHLHTINRIENYKVCWPSVKGENVRYIWLTSSQPNRMGEGSPVPQPVCCDWEANPNPIGLGPLPTAPIYKSGSPWAILPHPSTRFLLKPHTPVTQGAERLECTSSSCKSVPRWPEGPPALHQPHHRLHHLYTNWDRRDGHHHHRYKIYFDLFRINLSPRRDLLLTSDPGLRLIKSKCFV